MEPLTTWMLQEAKDAFGVFALLLGTAIGIITVLYKLWKGAEIAHKKSLENRIVELKLELDKERAEHDQYVDKIESMFMRNPNKP